ncbi:carboxypeptidase M32 [Cellvibrio polysaccharolyticus]|uniref:Metal-dependent carboxypeptidase n=1 Tax=Cellvibrio polysaccharolyticus TaxID=2082724 RepID=A0A928YSY4_9GAMM|nr:carboxypeptidase M32 [Cellvibrio polysaccharolyticus]MBE8716891.1 carboxypeptidase M32 [Cellvibrio polysaccharolyticus]
MSAFTKLQQQFKRLSRIQHAAAICGWDQAAMMPEGGNNARGEALAELSVISHQLLTAPELDDWFEEAHEEITDALDIANLATMKRAWQHATLLPQDLVEATSIANSRCEHAWRQQRKNNDWQGYNTNLKEVVRLAREQAGYFAEHAGLNRYDALMDIYEPGMSSHKVDNLFGEIKTWLPGLIDEAEEIQKTRQVITPQGPFPTEQQRQLGLNIMGLLGFDFQHGRLDTSTHPFCGGVPEDVRITTRYDEQNFMSALLGVIHETGHARYEQNLPRTLAGLPVGQARSMGVHESQSLFFEMQLARSLPFTRLIAPRIAEAFQRQQDPAFSADNLYQLNTRVKRGFIRVDADEVTYPAHVILRYEIERELIEGGIDTEHIPDLWNEKMESLLGLSTAGKNDIGCMQDIHWAGGAFGYFPSYTLGAMYAAQLFNAAQQHLPGLEEKIGNGDLGGLFEWLNKAIWSKASTLSTDELMRQATGEALNSHYFKQHLQQRYLA